MSNSCDNPTVIKKYFFQQCLPFLLVKESPVRNKQECSFKKELPLSHLTSPSVTDSANAGVLTVTTSFPGGKKKSHQWWNIEISLQVQKLATG